MNFIQGTTNNDSIHGSFFSEQIQGLTGDDILRGNQGRDTLLGSLGNDTLEGGKGDDILQGGEGNDWLIGGKGIDYFILSNMGGGLPTESLLNSGDTLGDFVQGTDLLILENGLTYTDVIVSQSAGNTLIINRQSGQILTVLFGQISLTPTDFIEGGQLLPIQAEISLLGQRIFLEVAQTTEEKNLGLMYRKELEIDRGMFFPISPPQIIGFWMKNVLIPLDMIFLRAGKIVKILSNVSPCLQEPCPIYSSDEVVDQVIELSANRAQQLNLNLGDSLSLKWL